MSVIPQLNPSDINATGAYAVAMALAMISFGIGAILRFLPSKTWKSEGRDLMKTAFEAVLLGSSILTANFIIQYVKGLLGVPDWKSLLEVIDRLITSGWESLNQVALLAMIFGAIVAVLDLLSKIVPVIMTFVMHFFMAVSFSILSFFAALSVILVVLSSAVKMVAALAAHAYLLVAAGIALFGWKHTRALGISLLVFGLALFYGLPAILGIVNPAAPYTTDPDEEARAKILLALTNSSVPTKITVVSGGGKPLFFSYIKMNSSVPVMDVPLNSTLIANITGGPPENGRGNITFPFDYGRFYSEGYERSIRCFYVEDPSLPVSCFDFGPDYSRIKPVKHQLYRNSTVRYVWYLGLFLPVRDNRVQVEGPSLMEPLIEIPSNPFEIAGSLYRAFGGLRSEDQYWEMVYGRSKPVELEVPVIRELNANVTAFVLYDGTPVIKNNASWPKYVAWREIPYTREYEHWYKIPKKSEECVITRTERYFDPSCNCTKERYYYKRVVVYHYETWDNYIPGDPTPGPKNDRLIAYVLPHTEVVPKVLWYSDNGPPGKSIVVPTVFATVNGTRAKEKGLILDYGPLKLKFNQGINRTKEIPEPTNEAANEVKGNPGEGSGTERELSEPLKEVVLYPPGEFWLIGISHTKILESKEQADRCPTLETTPPPELHGGAILGFDAKNAEPWDPSPLFYWKEYGKTGEYKYIPPRSYDKPPALGDYKPSDPRLAHRFYEEDPREPETNLKKYDVPLIMRFADPISQLSLISFALVITFAAADAVTMWLGGTSLGLAGVASIVAGKLGGGMKLPSPFSLSRYPFFGKDMGKQAMKKLEDRIWRDVRWKLKQREWEAKSKGDLATLKTIHDFYDIDRKVRRAQTVKRLANALGGRNTWWALNKLSGGRLERRVDNLERRRLEILSRIMPDEAVALQQLSRMKQEKRLTREEAWQILSMTKDQAKAQLKWAWPLAFLGLMVHTEGRTTLKSLLFGRFGGKAPAAWAMLGYKMPMAQEKLGINWIKVGEREDGGRRKPIGVPFPGMKARLLGPGLSYEITKEKVALERKVVGPDELKAELEKKLAEIREKAEREGREVKDPIDELLKHPSFRELSRSQIEEVLEGRGHGEYPVWHAIPVFRHIAPEEDGKVRIDYEVTHSRLNIDNRVPGSEPEIRIRREEAGDEIKVGGKMIDLTEKFGLSSYHSPFSSPEEEKLAEEKFREMVREKTRGLGDDWAWYGEITKAEWIDSRVDRAGKSDAGSEGSKPSDRSKDLWGDGE